MSVTNMNSRMAMAEKLSVPQLQQAIQSGSIPAYVGIPLIEQKMKAQKQASVPQQPEQRPIAQEVMEQASGIDSMPSNLPVSGYADGGIVAFAEGGDVDDDFDYESYLEQQEEAEYDDIIRKYAAEADAAGLEGIQINRTKKVDKKYADGGVASLRDGEIPRFQNRGLVSPLTYMTERARQNRENSESAEDTIDPAISAAAAQTIQDYSPDSPDLLNKPQGVPMREAFSTYADKLRQATQGKEGAVDPSMRAYTDTGMFSGMPEGGPTVLPPKDPEQMPTGMGDMDQLAGTTYTPTAKDNKAATSATGNAGSTGATSSTSARTAGGGESRTSSGTPERSERPRSAFDDFMADIKASREDLKKQQSQDKYMALLSAGLGMMSGTSPNAFANIGQGAQAGVASYGASAKQRAAERAALNKNLLMGQRYQSMEDIANRTADVNEARYRDAAAARLAGSGDAASLKSERLLNQRESDLNRAIGQRTTALQRQLETQFGKEGMYTNPNYQKEYDRLYRASIVPLETQLNALYSQRSPDLFGPNAAPQSAPAASSGFKIIK